MSLRKMIDRKLVLMVVSPIARALLSLAVGYLTAKGVPQNLLDQFVAAIGVSAMVAFNITWELVERRRAAVKAVTSYQAFQASAYVPFDRVRAQFERESG
jgi:hypothetical protein